MDFGLDTLIYIILGIVFLVAQVAKKRKPQVLEESADGSESTESSKSPSEDLFERILGYDEVPDPFDSPQVQEKIPPNSSEPLSSSELYLDSVQLNHSEDKRKEVTQKQKSDELTEDQKGKRKVMKEFDLRKAIIYSAILERKYF